MVKLLCIFVSLILVSCSTIHEIKKDDTVDVLNRKKDEIEKVLEGVPSVIEVPIQIRSFSLEEADESCKDTAVDVEFIGTDLSTILYSVAKVAGIGTVVSEKSEKTTTESVVRKENGLGKRNIVDPYDIKLSVKYNGNLKGLLRILSEKTGYFFVCS
ncbi:MAG: hypothetical protein NZ826_06910, partial [Thermodesulfovibrio sp.]|nr:hypothetical protein [Thermodesulfovibrio sp.]